VNKIGEGSVLVTTGRKGLSWIHRWGLPKEKPIELESDELAWLAKLAGK
jgi:hypothetical protein